MLCVQGLFVEQLYSSGMVDENEKESLLEPIHKNERRLLRKNSLGLSHRIDEVQTTCCQKSLSRSCAPFAFAQAPIALLFGNCCCPWPLRGCAPERLKPCARSLSLLFASSNT